MLTGRTAVVYGGSGAVGGAVSRAFAREGARVFLTARQPGPLEKLAAEIRATPARPRRRPSMPLIRTVRAAQQLRADEWGLSFDEVHALFANDTPLRYITRSRRSPMPL